MRYRAEIDGLRALAVLPVVLFHAGIGGFAGGFIGVDIFFVISGYLITSILLNDFDADRFSLLNFYERRARRILPALFAVMAVCVPAALLWLTPQETEAFAASALATIAFVSNVYFLTQSGYFAPAAETQPLLHTWSLAIEEQFYVFFPLVLLFLYRRYGMRGSALAVAALGLSSFFLAEIFRTNHADATFFLTPFRAWELMAGSLCAMLERLRPAKGNSVLGLSGIAMILAGFVLIDKSVAYPSTATLLPVIGTALVITYARTGTLAARMLSLSPFVGVGLISYSLYLWHQPLLAFAQVRSIGPLTTGDLMVILIASVVLSVATWHYVERPFRTGYGTRRGTFQLAGLAGAAAAIAVICAAGIGLQGVRQRFDQSMLLAAESEGQRAPQLVTCKVNYIDVEPERCRIGTPGRSAARIAVIGDSHASQLYPALEKLAGDKRWSFDLYSKSSCPIVDMPIGYASLGREYVECQTWRDNVWAQLKKQGYDLVLVTHSTLGYARFNGRYNLSAQEWEDGFDKVGRRFDRDGMAWAIMLDNPRFRQVDPVHCATRVRLFSAGSEQLCEVPREDAFASDASRAEAEVARRRGGAVIDLTDMFCTDSKCTPMPGGKLMMSDSNHLSQDGALAMSGAMGEALGKALGGHDAARVSLAHADDLVGR